ncbi:hypothetical protein OIU85_005771 [Salix viminalis]|uniref:Malectin-like domain-containing protein n=1 Tax=Salix viminalis TaxID=40686 RepID=A0A9Q0STS5_SALVM|nr:hypothetical protein OIU85_005771 [Salix viminalis]
MIRSTYLYGGINGNDSPPELMEHSSVANTTEDYRDGVSWLEGRLRVSVGVSLVARHSFIHNKRIRYPDDHFDRVWEPFGANNSTIPSSKNWPLSGLTAIALTPATGSSIDPLINIGEVFDVIALKNTYKRCNSSGNTEKQFQNAPLDCNGNPCMPRQFSWTGIACSEGSRIRVVTLNLTNLGLSGSLLLNAARLTALTGMGKAFGRQPIHWRDPFVAWKHKGSSRTSMLVHSLGMFLFIMLLVVFLLLIVMLNGPNLMEEYDLSVKKSFTVQS